MAYQCPRCGDKVSRKYSSTAQMAGGLVGALFVAAFGSFGCKRCGKIPRSEFPQEVRSRMLMGSLGLIVGAFVLFAVLVGVLVALR
jgi:purine-cytosine permease-like protein